jgi:hypothetical protein
MSRNRTPNRPTLNHDPFDILVSFGVKSGHDLTKCARAARITLDAIPARSPWPVARDAFLAAL